jgi:hypothetical protein
MRIETLVLIAQLPPIGVVLIGSCLSGEHLPPPVIDQVAERQKSNFLERLLEQKIDILLWIGCVVIEQADFLQVRRRCHRQGDCISNGFVKSRVRPISATAVFTTSIVGETDYRKMTG